MHALANLRHTCSLYAHLSMTQLYVDFHLGPKPGHVTFLVSHPVLGALTKAHVKFPHGPSQDELAFRIS